MAKKRADAVLVLSDPKTFFHRARIADLAMKRHLPTMHGVRGDVDAGGLMSSWAYQADLYRRVASYVDRILKGAKPADLPITQPTRFELVVNLKTAKSLGLTMPQTLLLRADEILQ
jgi:putative ABC transport system substrate-binding protein